MEQDSKFIYFHNLSFDGWFLIRQLFSRGYSYTFTKKLGFKNFSIISDNQLKIYAMSIRYRESTFIKIKCSYLITGESVGSLGKAIGKEKYEDFDYEKNTFDVEQNELRYIERDTEIPKEFMEMFYKVLDDDKVEKKLTIGGIAKYLCQKICNEKNPHKIVMETKNIYLLSEWKKYKQTYRGGVVFCNDHHRNELLHNVWMYDVNSMYPWAMTQPIPYKLINKPKYKQKNVVKLFHICITSIRPKEKYKMFHLFKIGKKMVNFYDGRLDYWIWEQELANYLVFFEMEYSIIEIEYWKTYPVYKAFIDQYYPLKLNAKNPVEKNVYKKVLNSAYGKIGEKPVKEEVIFSRYNREQLERWIKKKNKPWQIVLEKEFNIKPWHTYTILKYDCLRNHKGENKTLSRVYQAGYITMLARCKIFTTIINSNVEVIYGDTDSIKTIGELTNIETNDKELGLWKCEGKNCDFIYRRRKCYSYKEPGKEWEYHIAGFDNNFLKRTNWDPLNLVGNNDVIIDNAKKYKIRYESGIYIYNDKGEISSYDINENIWKEPD